MKAARIVAVLIVAGSAAWIASGSLGKDAQKPGSAAPVVERQVPRFKVAVAKVDVVSHPRRVVLSGRTEADRRATAIARGMGTIVALRVKRGSVVRTGEVVAILSDEAREAQVAQAKARLGQREVELKARLRLIENGNMAAINKPQLEAELRAAQAMVASAESERDKGQVLAPIDGVVNDVPVQVGQALQQGATVAEVIGLDPMLAVVEIAERQLNGVKIGDKAEVKLVTGETTTGTVRFVSRKASAQTRTYRVEVGVDNKKALIPDGVTCEVDLLLAAVPSARVPRSALTFSSEGKLGVRVVGEGDKVAFVPVSIVEDVIQDLWLAGLTDGARVIVQGQDFVKEGEVVEAATAGADNAVPAKG